jgi:hypothetical protein
MLVTSTLLFIIFAMRSGVDVLRLIVRRGAVTPTQRAAMHLRLEFLLGFALVLVMIYAIYLTTLRRVG